MHEPGVREQGRAARDAKHTSRTSPQSYQIRVRGRLDPLYSDWFGGLALTHEGEDIVVLAGPVADQAALHGILAQVRDLGLPLLSLSRVQPERDTEA
jgi:hypothetical protein